MGSEWLDTTIGEQVLLQRGSDITKAQQRPGRIPVVSSGGISSYHDTALHEAPGVVLGRKGTLGTVFYLQEDYWPHDTTLWVKDFKSNYPRFVYYFFNWISDDLLLLDNGTANPSLNRNHVHPLRVSWPPLDDQRAIASVLGSLDDKIELNRRMNGTLEEMASTIFKSWFVDFDPVVAKSLGKKPFGMSPELAAMFPDSFVETEEGQIPKGWVFDKVGSVCYFLYGKALKEADRIPGSIPVYGSNGRIGWHNAKLANGPAVIVGRKGNAGAVSWCSNAFYAIDTTFYVGPKPGFPSARYLYHALSQQDLPSLAADSAVPGLNREVACMNAILVPSPCIAQAFDQTVKPLWERQSANESDCRTLAALRDLLLPKLLSGEIRPKQAEKMVEAAV